MLREHGKGLVGSSSNEMTLQFKAEMPFPSHHGVVTPILE